VSRGTRGERTQTLKYTELCRENKEAKKAIWQPIKKEEGGVYLKLSIPHFDWGGGNKKGGMMRRESPMRGIASKTQPEKFKKKMLPGLKREDAFKE